MALGVGRALVAPLLFLNFSMYLISAAIAGSILNKGFDNGSPFGVSIGYGNAATYLFLVFTLVASMVGLASTLAGLLHVGFWRTDSLAASAAAAVIAWTLTLLAMGLACKEIHIGGHRPGKLKTIEAFMIILSLFELLYLLALHAGSVTDDGYNAPVGAGPKNPTYGTPAATAV